MSLRPLIVPCSSVASGVVSYVASMSRLDGVCPTFLAVPDSELEAQLAPETATIATTGSMRDIADRLGVCWRDYDCVLTHGPRAILAARVARVSSRAIAHTVHEFPWVAGRSGWGELALTVRAMRAANAPAVATSLARMRLGVDATLEPIVRSSPSLMSRGEARARLGLPDEADPIVGVIGRLAAAKEPEVALRACVEIAHRGAAVKLVFVGDGPLAAPLRATEVPPQLDIRMVGHVPGAADLVRAFDVLVVPSRHETFGIVIDEALLAGVPVAAVRSPGAQVHAAGGHRLHLADPTPGDLARAIDDARRSQPPAPPLESVERLAGEYVRFIEHAQTRAAAAGKHHPRRTES